MTEIALQFRYTPAPQRPACARFIPGSDPSQWLTELIASGQPLDAIRLYPIPFSRSDNRCRGVLAALNGPGDVRAPASPTLATLPQSFPYGCIENRLWLPVEAAVAPELTNAEWNGLWEHGASQYIWHPQSGLIAFETAEVLTVVDLLAPRQPTADLDWRAARPGVIFPSRIVSIRAELPSTVGEILEEGRDNIATRTSDVFQSSQSWSNRARAWGVSLATIAGLPLTFLFNQLKRLFSARPAPSPATPTPVSDSEVPRSQASGLWGSFLLLASVVCLAQSAAVLALLPLIALGMCVALLVTAGILITLFMQRASVPAPRSPPAKPKLGASNSVGFNLKDYFARMLRWTSGLLDARQREINRLVKMLQDDPDEGLKFALPMAGSAGRGLAPPGARLLQRQIDFRLGGASGPTDFWDLPLDSRLALTTRYRELATREIQLGRYRRAAYIYAELLGDLTSAAVALYNGRLYREAAVLYRDKLNRPLDAARCLTDGGLLLEAISIYQQAGHFEEAGDLHRRLEEHAAAESAYRQATATSLTKGDYLDAARLLSEKVGAPDEALHTLEAGWPQTGQARRCLDASFSLLTRLGRHSESLAKIQALRDANLSPQRTIDAVEVLAATAIDSPHAASRVLASDTVRVLASQALIAGHPQHERLIGAVGRLAVQDKLLYRDCRRASDNQPWQRKGRPPQPKTPAVSKLASGVIRVKTYQLPSNVEWTAACESDDGFFAVGHTDRVTTVAYGAWDDPQATVRSLHWPRTFDTRRVLMCHSRHTRTLNLGSTGNENFSPREFYEADRQLERTVARTPQWMPQDLSSMAVTPNGTIYTFQRDQLLLTSFSSDQRLTSTETLHAMEIEGPLDDHQIYPMAASDNIVYVAMERNLCESRAGGVGDCCLLSDHITGVAVSLPPGQHRLAATFPVGGMICWSSVKSGPSARFSQDLVDPRAVFFADGRLVVHGHAGWQVYATDNEELRLLLETPATPERPVFGLLRAPSPRQVALCLTDGRIEVYAIR